MVPAAIPPLVWCSLWAVPTALLASRSLPSGALLAVLGLLVATRTTWPGARAGLAALPALLAALPLPAPPPPALPLGPVRLDGIVHSVTRAPVAGTLRVVLGHHPPGLPVLCDGDLEVLPGDRLRVLAHVAEAPAPDLPRSVHAVVATAQVTPGPASLARLAAAGRRALERQLLTLLPAEPGALLASLVLGRDTRPGREVQEAHRATGLSHLLAVSGAHAALLAFLLGLGGRHGRRRLLGSPHRTRVLLATLVVYAAITGCEPPVLRAVAAAALAAVATRLGRPCGPVPLLLAPAVLTAFVQPAALLGPSFLLSYAAVAGLALAPPRGQGRWHRWLLDPLRASAAATCCTAPFTLWFFGQLAPWTVLLTPLLAPLVGVLLVGGLGLALLGCALPALAAPLAVPLGWLCTLYADCVQAADALPATPLPALAAPPGWLVLLTAAAGAAFVAVRPTAGRIAAALLLVVLPYFAPLGPPPTPRLQLFAVGHGQACLLTTGGHTCAIDCGSMQHPWLAAERLVAALPQRRLDLIVVTHADSDHHNGLATLLARVRIAAAVVPRALAASDAVAALRAHGAVVTVLDPGTTVAPLQHLRLAAPNLPEGASDNDQSLWVSATLAGTTVLLTGDAQELGVAAALAAGIATPHDVLVLPHHGRANANAPALLARVQPRACLASAACADGETPLGPLVRRSGRELWVTGLHGSLTLTTAPPALTGATPARTLPPR